jgi:hypothetical protein
VLAYLRDEQPRFKQDMLKMLDDALSKLDQVKLDELTALAGGFQSMRAMMSPAAKACAPDLSEREVRDPWVHLATAFLDLSLSLNDLHVERLPGNTQTLLSVYSNSKNSHPDFFVKVERQADIETAKSVHQASSQHMMQGVPMRSAQVTADAELVVDSTLASLMHSNQTSPQLQVIIC